MDTHAHINTNTSTHTNGKERRESLCNVNEIVSVCHTMRVALVVYGIVTVGGAMVTVYCVGVVGGGKQRARMLFFQKKKKENTIVSKMKQIQNIHGPEKWERGFNRNSRRCVSK